MNQSASEASEASGHAGASIVKPKLLVLVGPTAAGKTALSLELATAYRCEIISGDSMQIYRGMDIGTAKASQEERARVPHHLIDIHDPDYPFSAAEFQQRVTESIADITQRGKLPFLVGGTGLYIESVCYHYRFVESTADEAFRAEQRAYAERHGTAALHARLERLDPEAAARIHPNDLRRIVRALEQIHLLGGPPDRQQRGEAKESPYDLCIIGLTMERQQLYNRINDRVDQMVVQGLVREVQGLLEQGYTSDLVSMQALGYKEIAAYLQGEIGFEEAIDMLKQRTRRFAKRQLSWFRHMPAVEWVDLSEHVNFNTQLQQINDIIAGKLGLHRE